MMAATTDGRARTDAMGIFVAALGGAVGYWVSLQVVYQALCLLVLADLLFGTMAALLNKTFSPSAIGQGATRKALTLLFVTLLAYLSQLTEMGIPAGETLAIFYIWRELVSVTQHYIACGGQVPDQVKQLLAGQRIKVD